MEYKKMTIGYIANGKSTNRYHLYYALERSDKIKVKTIYERNLENTKWERVTGIQYTDQLEDLLNDSEIDVVVVCTPPQAHLELAKKVLNAGKHCVVEKPFCQTQQEAKEIFDLAKEKGLIVQCYQNRRFDGDFLTAQKVIESGLLGEIFEMELTFDYYRPSIPENEENFSVINSLWYGHGTHSLDQVISYFGKPDKVHYDVRQLLGEGRMNDYFDVDMYYGALKVSVKTSFNRVQPRPSIVVYGRRGMFIKKEKDIQEEQLKNFYMPENANFGEEPRERHGKAMYYDNEGMYHEKRIPTEKGDYGKFYDALYETIVFGKEKLVKDEETLLQLKMLEEGIQGMK